MNEDWKPHPRQQEALTRPEFEVLYGGARGGGKTDAGLIWLLEYINHPRFRALVIRKNADDLKDWVDRASRLFQRYGARIAYRPAEIKFPSGAKIVTGHLNDDQAYTKYQGQEYHRILIEELTQIPDENRYGKLIASCRSTIPELRPQIFATTNPGGVGHVWVKKRFVDPAEPNVPFRDLGSGRTRIFIPATVDDNPSLMLADPDYIRTLDAMKATDEETWKAWRLGDWNTFAGQYFKEWNKDLHVINPFMPDKNNVIVGGLDWGRVDAFAFYLTEVSRINFNGRVFYRSKVFLEVYGTEKTPKEWSDVINTRLKGFNLTLSDIAWIRADTQIYQKGLDAKALDIYSQFVQASDGFRRLKPANKDRIGGWENLHQWLSLAPDGKPYLQFASNCINAVRTIPELRHDENKVEDVGVGEDHSGDSIRYLHMALKWIDGGVGAVVHPRINYRIPIAPQFINQKQVSFDLDAFSTPDANSGDVGAVQRN